MSEALQVALDKAYVCNQQCLLFGKEMQLKECKNLCLFVSLSSICKYVP